MSSTFGRSGDFDDHVTRFKEEGETFSINSSHGDAADFQVETAGDPLVEPIFGTRYWSHPIPDEITVEWEEAMRPQMPSPEMKICLPPKNPFIPEKFDLKELPPDDSHHPLLFCALKICVPMGKKKVSSSVFICNCSKFYCFRDDTEGLTPITF